MNEIKLYQKRSEQLIEDLAARITVLDPQVGATVIIQPNNPYFVWTDAYKAWLAEVVQYIAKPGVKYVLVETPEISFKVEN